NTDESILLHYDGNGFAPILQTTAKTQSAQGVWGSSPGDVFVVGYRGILHKESVVPSKPFVATNHLHGLFANAPNDIFAVGDGGPILHFDGQTWTAMGSGTTAPDFFGVWASGPKDVFAVGAGGWIQHYDGDVWQDMGVATFDTDLYGVWGSGPKDVFAVGTGE